MNCPVCGAPMPDSTDRRTVAVTPSSTCSPACAVQWNGWNREQKIDALLGRTGVGRYLMEGLAVGRYHLAEDIGTNYEIRPTPRPPCQCPNPDGASWAGCPDCRYVGVLLEVIPGRGNRA